MNGRALRELVLREAARLGFELAGIAAVTEFPRAAQFRDWIAQGRAGTMDYLARTTPLPEGGERARELPAYLREDIRNAYPWAVSLICLGVVYNTAQPRSVEVEADSERGWISRYAWGDDYHEVLRARLAELQAALLADARAAGAQCRIAVDTAPILEREAAVRAGLGWQAKNTCLIHPAQGSYFFLGSLVTSLEIEADSPLPDRCGSCTRCIDACPTGALDEPYRMDARRCLAYLNIELRGPIPEEFRGPMGDNVFGCDICQDVCPWNRRAAVTLDPAFQPRPGLFRPRLQEMARWTEAEYRVHLRGSAMKRAKFTGLQRNLAVAMGNSGNPDHRPALEQLAKSEDETVREHARWALDQLECGRG